MNLYANGPWKYRYFRKIFSDLSLISPKQSDILNQIGNVLNYKKKSVERNKRGFQILGKKNNI